MPIANALVKVQLKMSFSTPGNRGDKLIIYVLIL